MEQRPRAIHYTVASARGTFAQMGMIERLVCSMQRVSSLRAPAPPSAAVACDKRQHARSLYDSLHTSQAQRAALASLNMNVSVLLASTGAWAL